MKRALLAFAVASGFPVWGATFLPVIAIRDAHVITGAGTDLARGTVVLRNGLIEAVGADISVPVDATVIDGAGLTVYPGFIDGLSTWGIASAAPPAGGTGAGGVAVNQPVSISTMRSHGPEDRPQTFAYEHAADLVTPTDSRLEAARAAGFTSAATFPNRGIVEGLGALVDLAGERGRDMVVAEPLGEQIVLRTGGFRSGFPGSLMGDISYVRQLFLDEQHSKSSEEIYRTHVSGNRRPEYDHALSALGEAPRLLLPADQYQQIDRMLAFGKELNMPFVLYGLHEGFERVEELKKANVPLLISLKWPDKAREADPAEVDDYRELKLRDQAPAVPGMLAKAGLEFGFFSDGIASAPDLKKAVRKAIDAGLPPADAIAALSLNIAKFYGVADRMGSIEKGKIANVVVTRGNIFEDKPNIQYVFIDGEEFRPSEDAQKGTVPRPSGGRPPTQADATAGDDFMEGRN